MNTQSSILFAAFLSAAVACHGKNNQPPKLITAEARTETETEIFRRPDDEATDKEYVIS